MIKCTLGVINSLFSSGIVVGVVYCTCGVFYKRSQGAIGLEQIPNIEVWKSVWSRLGDLIDVRTGLFSFFSYFGFICSLENSWKTTFLQSHANRWCLSDR